MSAKLGPSIVYTTREAYDSMSKHVATDIYILTDVRIICVGDQEYTRIPEAVDLSDYATKQALSDAVSGLASQQDLTNAVSGLITQQQLESAIADFLTSSEIAETYATKAELEDYLETETAASTYATKEELASLSAQVAGAFHFKGSVNAVENLPNDAAEGDVYQIGDAEYAWNGSSWVNLGDVFDLSEYSTTEEVNAAIAEYVAEQLADYDTAEEAAIKTEEAIADATEGIVDQASEKALDDLFLLLKAAGYKGTRSTFPVSLAHILNEKNNIVVSEGSDTASIAGSNLKSVAEAMNAAEANSAITFVADGEADANIQLSGNTVDMAGYMLETDGHQISVEGTSVVRNANVVDNSKPQTSAESAVMFYAQEAANLTIADSDIDTTGCDAIYADAGSTVTLDNVAINNSIDPDVAAQKFDSKPVMYADNATINFKSGEIIADTSSDDTCGLYGIYAANGSTIVLGDQQTGEGPTIITNSAPIGTNNTTGSVHKLTIYGGYYKSLMTHPQWMGAMYFGGGCDTEIFGGTFDGGDYDIALPYRPAKYIIKIHGGTFEGKVITIKKDYKNGGSGDDPDNTLDQIIIDGGKFAAELDPAWIASGYEQVKVGSYWVVRQIEE